jgi:hypothetical protein
VATACGLGLLWLWATYNVSNLFAAAAGLSFLIAMYWGLQYAILTGRIFINRSGGISMRKHPGNRERFLRENKAKPAEEQPGERPENTPVAVEPTSDEQTPSDSPSEEPAAS